MKISNREVLLGYIAYFFKYTGNIIVLPFILSNLSTSTYAIWNIFLAINSFVFLFDLGYGVVIQRNIMYAYSGAKSISDGLPTEVMKESPNFELLYQIMLISKRIYNRMTILVLFVLVITTPYIIFISTSETSLMEILSAWLIFSWSVLINVFVMSDSTILKGLGMIGKLQRITLINSIVSTFLKPVFLVLGMGIIGLSLSFFISAVMLFFQYKVVVEKIKDNNRTVYDSVKKEGLKKIEHIYTVISKKSKGIGGVLLSNFIQNQLFTIVLPIFYSLEIVGRYSLSNQLINVIASLAGISFSTFTIQMGHYMIIGERIKLKKMFTSNISIFLIIYLLGTVALLTFGSSALNIVGSNTEMVSKPFLMMIAIYILINQIISKSTNIISMSNDQSYVPSLIITSFTIMIIDVFLMISHINIMMVVVVNIIILSSYNLWKWSGKAMKLCNSSLNDIYIGGKNVISFFIKKMIF